MKSSLEMYEELKGTHLTENQARAIIKTMQSCVEDRISEFVTVPEFRMGIRELEVKIEAGRVDTLKWMGTLLMDGIIIILGAMYFMFTMFLHH